MATSLVSELEGIAEAVEKEETPVTEISLPTIAERIAKHLGELLGLEIKETPKKELLEKLEHAEQAVAVSA